ncbi:hypothetical protein MTR67_033247 [Solanum verrucosum]|uniref:Uncharacterized protein n=1 Tax=Solanum verrucosum TaxID=315347 RepID=A0AAF0U5Q3_SOLVR|nr:hypothetical protein MTR67_033247 [Solanum verrucosum]
MSLYIVEKDLHVLAPKAHHVNRVEIHVNQLELLFAFRSQVFLK